jgi:hypothetical protein
MEAAREAVKLGLPCLVMSPELFAETPDGNVSLLDEGKAVELRPGELADALASQPMGPQLGLGLDDDD